MTRPQRWRAAGDPDAECKLAERIKAVLGNRPLLSYPEVNSARRAD